MKVHKQLGIYRAGGKRDNLSMTFNNQEHFEEFQDELTKAGDKIIGQFTIKPKS